MRGRAARRKSAVVVGADSHQAATNIAAAQTQIRVEVPVQDAHGRRAARRCERSPGFSASRTNTDRSSARGPVEQSAVRNAAIQPRHRRAFERPADGDPLLVELQRNGDGDERERGAGHERQPADVTLRPPARAEAGPRAETPAPRRPRPARRRPPSRARRLRVRDGRPKKNIALANTAAMYGSRSFRARVPSTNGYAMKTAYSAAARTRSKRQSRPGVAATARPPSTPGRPPPSATKRQRPRGQRRGSPPDRAT